MASKASNQWLSKGEAFMHSLQDTLLPIGNLRRRRRLRKLKKVAEESKLDSEAQAAYLRLLVDANPGAVLKYVDEHISGTNSDAEVVQQYVKALVKTDKIAEYGTMGADDPDTNQRDSMTSLLARLTLLAKGDKAFLKAGESSTDPLHVVLHGQKAVGGERPVGSTILGTLLAMGIFSLVWTSGAVLIRRYVKVDVTTSASPSSNGANGLSAYAPKEYSKDNIPEKQVKTFKDVKGCDEAKAELEEIVEYLKSPGKFTRLGGKLPKGVLLTGPPGTGKTLLARATAGEAGVPFFYRAGSEFEEMFVGVGSRRVRSLFAAAKRKAPCIIFIDEIDAVGGNRKQWESHTRKTLNQLLVEMDGFEENTGIIVMAATNLQETLDPALTRPGRFDRHVAVNIPDYKGRKEILDLYLQDKPTSDDVDSGVLARGTVGFSGADLYNLVNTAACSAAKDGADAIDTAVFEFAKDKILMGAERKSMLVSEESKRLTAYHESGHAIVALFTKGALPVHKATIMPRGNALGMVTQLPDKDETSISKEQMLARLDVCMGGRVAEQMIFGEEKVTTGARSDLQQATSIARHMIAECGMSDAIGPVYVDDRAFKSRQLSTAVDSEVVTMLKQAQERVKRLLSKHSDDLHTLAKALVERETLNQKQIAGILGMIEEKTVDKGAAASAGKERAAAAGEPLAGAAGKEQLVDKLAGA